MNENPAIPMYAERPQDIISEEQRMMAGGGVDNAVRMAESLARMVRDTYEENVRYRDSCGATAMLQESLEYCRRVYSDERMTDIKSKGAPPVFSPMVDEKRRALMAMLSELFSNGEKSWSLSPTPVPELPMDIRERAYKESLDYISGKIDELNVEDSEAFGDIVYYFSKSMLDIVKNREDDEARKRCARMERLVNDQMVEGEYDKAFKQFVNNVVTYGTGIIKGPIPNVVRSKKYVKGKGGVWKIVFEDKEALTYEAVNPWDVFPSKGAKTVEDGPVCIRTHFRPNELRRFAKRVSGQVDKGWVEKAVNAILSVNPSGGVAEQTGSDSAKEAVSFENGRAHEDTCLVEGVEYFGDVRGSLLKEAGVKKTSDGKAVDDEDYYSAHVITVRDVVVYCRVLEPEIGIPLSKAVCFEPAEGWFGDSLAMVLKADQDILNAAMRDLCVNMAMASGPQVAITDAERIIGSDYRMSPWKLWMFRKGDYGDQSLPIKMMQPESNAQELLAVIDNMTKRSDIDSGVPAYSYGSSNASGVRTVGQLSILTENASRGIKAIVTGIDMGVIRTVVRKTVDYNMVYSDDPEVKGDINVNASGLMGLILKEQELQRITQFLQSTMNEYDMGIVGKKGRALMLRENVKKLGINPDLVVPTDEMLEAMEMAEREKQRMEEERQRQMQEQQMAMQRQAQEAQIASQQERDALAAQEVQTEEDRAAMEAAQAQEAQRLEEERLAQEQEAAAREEVPVQELPAQESGHVGVMEV